MCVRGSLWTGILQKCLKCLQQFNVYLAYNNFICFVSTFKWIIMESKADQKEIYNLWIKYTTKVTTNKRLLQWKSVLCFFLWFSLAYSFFVNHSCIGILRPTVCKYQSTSSANTFLYYSCWKMIFLSRFAFLCTWFNETHTNNKKKKKTSRVPNRRWKNGLGFLKYYGNVMRRKTDTESSKATLPHISNVSHIIFLSDLT